MINLLLEVVAQKFPQIFQGHIAHNAEMCQVFG